MFCALLEHGRAGRCSVTRQDTLRQLGTGIQQLADTMTDPEKLDPIIADALVPILERAVETLRSHTSGADSAAAITEKAN